MKKNKSKKQFRLIVKYDGAIVGRRQTHVPYTHALVVRINEDIEREEAYSELGPDCDGMFRGEVKIADGKSEWEDFYDDEGVFRKINASDIAKFKAKVEGGFDAWRVRERQRKIDRFEKEKRDGRFTTIHVKKWLRPEQAARGIDESFNISFSFAKIVPVESEETISIAQRVAKLPKATLRDILADICGRMIERKAWDEIGTFIAHQLGPEDAPLVLKLMRK